LTRAGVTTSRRIFPEIRRPNDCELAVAVASWMDERRTLIRGRRPRDSKKKKMSTTTNPILEEAVEGIEVEMEN
jgi:hypothetical protein